MPSRLFGSDQLELDRRCALGLDIQGQPKLFHHTLGRGATEIGRAHV